VEPSKARASRQNVSQPPKKRERLIVPEDEDAATYHRNTHKVTQKGLPWLKAGRKSGSKVSKDGTVVAIDGGLKSPTAMTVSSGSLSAYANSPPNQQMFAHLQKIRCW